VVRGAKALYARERGGVRGKPDMKEADADVPFEIKTSQTPSAEGGGGGGVKFQ